MMSDKGFITASYIKSNPECIYNLNKNKINDYQINEFIYNTNDDEINHIFLHLINYVYENYKQSYPYNETIINMIKINFNKFMKHLIYYLNTYESYSINNNYLQHLFDDNYDLIINIFNYLLEYINENNLLNKIHIYPFF